MFDLCIVGQHGYKVRLCCSVTSLDKPCGPVVARGARWDCVGRRGEGGSGILTPATL